MGECFIRVRRFYFAMKKGQASGAAVLLAIIAGLLVAFIVLLPPAERAELLGDEDGDSGTTSGINSNVRNAVSERGLLAESPGRIDYYPQDEVEHPLPVVTLYTRTESEILAEMQSSVVRRGVFSREDGTFSFRVNDLPHTDNVLLTFGVDARVGRLVVSLNGEEIYAGEPGQGGIAPINLPKEKLRESNVLEFGLSNPGFAFWRTHEAALSSIKVIGDVTNVEAQSSRQIFLVSDVEKDNLERIRFRFQPDCEFGEVGKLEISLNGEPIYDSVPDCEVAMVPIDIGPGLIHAGENEVRFRTTRGTYLLSNIKILSDLKPLEFPTYYFEMSNEEFEDVVDEKRRVRMSLHFVDISRSKRGEVIYNGHKRHFDTKEDSIVIDLSEDAERGTNSIKLIPRKTVEVRELRVELVK